MLMSKIIANIKNLVKRDYSKRENQQLLKIKIPEDAIQSANFK